MIFNEAALRIMCNYPVDILKAVTDPGAGLPAKLKWFPSLAELKEACEMLMDLGVNTKTSSSVAPNN